MKISKILNTVENKITQNKILKNDARINRYINIHDTTASDSFEKMYNAREVIANYAEKNGVMIDIYDAKNLTDRTNSRPSYNNNLSEKINIIVTNLLNGKSKAQIIEADTDKIYPKSNFIQISTINPNSHKIVYKNVNMNSEDNFLRHLYRNIEYLTNCVTKKDTK